MDFQTGLVDFLFGCGCLIDANPLHFFFIGFHGETEQITLQMCQFRVVPKTRHTSPFPLQKHILFPVKSLLRHQTLQRRHRLGTEVEKFLLPGHLVRVIPLVHVQRHNHPLCKLGQGGDDMILDGGKSRKPVKNHHTSLHQSGFGQHPAEPLQRLLGGHIFFPDITGEFFIQNRQILQFTLQCPSASGLSNHVLQLFHGHAVLHKFGNGGFHLMDIADFVQIFSNHRQVLRHIRRHFTKYQTFARIVQHWQIVPAHLVKNAVGQTPKAQHINV